MTLVMNNELNRPEAHSDWSETLRLWFADQDELLLSYTLPNAGGAGGYTFCTSQQSIDEFISTLPAATRICVYRHHSLTLRGVVDEEFARQARVQMPSTGDFLLVSMEESDYSYGYLGYLGDTAEELDEILSDTNGERAAFGPSPATNQESERLIVYKNGIIAAY